MAISKPSPASARCLASASSGRMLCLGRTDRYVHDVVLDVSTTEQLHVLVQTVVDRTILPSVVNTQILSPFKNADPAVKIAFPGVNVNDREQANVRPPSPGLCVGNGFIVETTDLVSWHHLYMMAYKQITSLRTLSIADLLTARSTTGVGAIFCTFPEECTLSSDGCLQAFKVYNIKGEILAGPVSLVDFFGHSVTGSFSDAACKQCF